MLNSSSNHKWFAYYRPNPVAQLRLFCFPYAGGSAIVFRTWQDNLPPGFEVCPVELPGRGARLREAPFTRLLPLVEAMAEALLPYFHKPFAFFGHSMGALIAFELARHLRRHEMKGPQHLFAAGHVAPQVGSAHEPIYNLPEAEFKAELGKLNGTPAAVLENEELMQLLIPVLRADFAVNETYEYIPDAPLDCPISAYGGSDDSDVSRESLDAWRTQTTAAFSIQMLPGDHFFLQTAQLLLFQALSRELAFIASQLNQRG